MKNKKPWLSILVIIIFMLFVLWLFYKFSLYLGEVSVDLNNIYYFFSTSAQVIGAFIAFILAGYIFIHQMMDLREEKDDTLKEIHKKLKNNYYIGLRNLSIASGFSITLDLLVLFSNDFDSTYPIHNLISGYFPFYKTYIMLVTSVLNIVTIICAIALVIYIINPKTYDKAINSLMSETTQKFSDRDLVDEKEFFVSFVKLERDIRHFIQKNKNVVFIKRRNNKGHYSFREMIDGLFHSGVLPEKLYGELLEISKYRNLLFHGNLDTANEGMVKTVINVHERLKGIFEEFNRQA